MLSFIDFENENILGMHVKGKLSDAEYDSILEKTNQLLEKYPKINLYTEIEDFKGTSIENYFKDLKFAISNWNRFEKSAVVTDKEWVKKYSEVANKIFPNVEMKSFFWEEKQLAKAWVRNP